MLSTLEAELIELNGDGSIGEARGSSVELTQAKKGNQKTQSAANLAKGWSQLNGDY
jgi:hypothetical protein